MNERAKFLLRTLNNAGFQAYICGGACRDMLLGKKEHDIDIMTTATPEQISYLFKNVSLVGKSFGVSLVKVDNESFEIATARKDGLYMDHRRPDSVSFTSEIEEDIQHRDFTVNALLMDLDGNIYDFVNGKKDLETGIIRCVGNPDERFKEDSLRLLRAVRFCAQHDFILDHQTMMAIRQNSHLISHVSPERIWGEIKKILISGKVAKAFDILEETLLLDYIFPEIVAEIKKEEKNNLSKFNTPYAYRITKKILKLLPKNCSITLSLATLLHSISNNFGIENIKPIDFLPQKIMDRLALDKDTIEIVLSHLKNYKKFNMVSYMKKSDKVNFARLKKFDELLQLARYYNYYNQQVVEMTNFVKDNENLIYGKPLVTGYDLIEWGFTPNPSFKYILKAIEDGCLNAGISSKEKIKNKIFPLQTGEYFYYRKNLESFPIIVKIVPFITPSDFTYFEQACLNDFILAQYADNFELKYATTGLLVDPTTLKKLSREERFLWKMSH